jgi:hypothetical protein
MFSLFWAESVSVLRLGRQVYVRGLFYKDYAMYDAAFRRLTIVALTWMISMISLTS